MSTNPEITQSLSELKLRLSPQEMLLVRCKSERFEPKAGHRPGAKTFVQGLDYDASVFAVVFPKSRDGRHHDRSGPQHRFVDCNRRERPDLGLASSRQLRLRVENCCERQPVRLGYR